ncbi:CocE/NonD family hydrolase [Chloroflexota bacterium]
MKKVRPTVRAPLPSGIKLEENVYVTMRDGVKIAVDVYHPTEKGSYPALVSMSPYIKEIQQWPPVLTHSIEAGSTRFFVPKGYVHVIVQIRGTGMSQGQYDILDKVQQEDGYELVEWAARQPWCNGSVGMMGDSYFAMTQYMVAALQPPHLKCIAPCDGATDLYRDFFYKGGIFNAWFFGFWAPDTYQQCVWPGPIKGKLPTAHFLEDLITHTEDGPYWWERSTWRRIDKIKVPVLSLVPGNSGYHLRGQLNAYPQIQSPKILVVMQIGAPGGAHMMFMTNPVSELLLKWYDYWLKDIDTGIMDKPPVAICDGATQEWRYENEYPLARTKWTEFYLRSNPAGRATEPPYGLISIEKPAEQEEPDRYITPESLISLSPTAAGKPAVAYTTQPLDKDVKVCGPISATLYASSTTFDTGWFIKLGDIAPNGNVAIITDGMLRASHREVGKTESKPGQPFHPHKNPVFPEPNKVYEYQIELWPRFYTFKAGHKIWVQISSIDTNYQMQLHSVYTSEMLPIPAENTIYHDKARPSHLLLPVIPDTPTIKAVEPLLSKIKWPPREMV